jgi:predicted phage baseplate assembly protein
MPVRPPRLDDRTYDDLVAELVRRIPAHTPEWTNPRPGDPGRTLIELFAWLGDALLYRVNLIPERQRLAFLRLLGQPLRSARAAKGLVSVSLKENEAAQAYRVRPLATLNGPVTFEVRDEFTVLPVTAAAYYKRITGPNEIPSQVLQALADFHVGGAAVKGYVTTPLFAEDRPVPDGFDVFADTADHCLWIALLAPTARPPAPQTDTNAEVRTILGESASGGRQLLNIGFVPALPTADPLAPVTSRAKVPHVWEITANTTGRAVNQTNLWAPEYLALDELADTTGGLTRRGIVRLALPPSTFIHAPENDIRVDENAGVADRPPRLDDEGLASRLVAWIRLRPAPPPRAGPAPQTQFNTGQGAQNLQNALQNAGVSASVSSAENLRVVWAGINTVEIEQFVTRTNLIFGESTGAPDQEVQLPATNIEPETLRLEVEEESGWVAWQRVDDIATLERDASLARDARVFQLDPALGTVVFGDGVRGKIPANGQRLRAALMRSGGGEAGNLQAATLKAVSATTVTGESVGSRFVVAQPLPLTGGAEAEALVEAEKRIPGRLRHRERAVTSDDYRALAFEAPGISIGRVEILPRFKPQQRHDNIPGVVTVMSLPARPIAPAPNPRSDRPFLESLHAWLDARRPLGTEFYVIGCEYVPVAVSVAVSVAETAQPETTLQAVKDALVRVLWPMGGGGFDQGGWPLGRALSNRELAVEVARVAGVREVAGLNLFTRSTSTSPWTRLGDSRDGREQNLILEKWQLPELLGVTAIVGDEAPLQLAAGLNPAADPNAVAVPVVPDIC